MHLGADGRLRRPSRVVRAALGWALLLLVIGGCGRGAEGSTEALKESAEPVSFSFSGDAATVDDQAIPASTIEDQLDILRANPGYTQVLLGTAQVDQVGRSEPSANIVALLLTDEIYSVAVSAELDQRGVEVLDGARSRAETQLRVQFGSALDDLPPEYRLATVNRDAARLTLEGELAPPADEADLRAAYDDSIEDFEESCVRHVLAPNQEVGQAVAERLISGEDWNVVAAEVSLDERSAPVGGELGCWPRNSWLAEFDDAVWAADVGVVTGPLTTDVGFHVLEVVDRYTRTFDDVRDVLAVRATPQSDVVLGSWLAERLTEGVVAVDPGFGTWDTTALSVAPVGAGPAVEFNLQEDREG